MISKIDYFLTFSLILILAIYIVILSIKRIRRFINTSSVRNFFRILASFFVLLIIFFLLDWFFLKTHFYTISLLFGCFWGIAYSNIEFWLIIRKRIKGNYFYNNAIVPSVFLAVIATLGISLLLCIIYHGISELCGQIRANTYYFVPGFIVFYCLIFYLRFNKLENERGTIYFKNKILR